MVLGIGIDIIEIERIKESIERFPERFVNKIFTQVERDYCLSKKNKYQHFAARFAAKEAIAKAFGNVGISGLSWQEVEIFNERNGTPQVKLTGKPEQYLGDDKQIKITMSHSHHYVTCFAILFSSK